MVEPIIFLLNSIFAIFDGFIDARHWHIKIRAGEGAYALKDSHPERFARRVAASLMGSIAIFAVTGFWKAVLMSLCLGLCFNFFHHGAMYSRRNTLDPGVYPLGWFDQSFTTKETAFWTSVFTPVNRTVLFAIGTFFYFVTYLW